VYGKSEEAKKVEITMEEFLTKCNDLSVNIKEVEKIYQRYIKVLKEYNKSHILYEKKYFKNIKKNYYKYISKKEQKELERVTKNHVLALRTEGKLFKELSNVTYKLAQAKRIKSPNAKDKIKKAEKNFDTVLYNKYSSMLTKLSLAIDEYNKVYDDIITKNMKEILRKKFNNKNNINKQIMK
jgi:hypothetical protein